MKQRISSFFLIVVMLTAIITAFPVTANAAMNIKLGDYVQMGTYYGQPILWRCVGFEKISGYDASGNPIINSMDTVTQYKDGYLPLMLADKVLCIKPFDASGNNLNGSHGRCYFNEKFPGLYRRTRGSDYWGDSNMRCWLNSTASAGNVVWTCGNPPDEDNVYKGYNDYAGEAGFLTNFTPEERKAMKAVTQKFLLCGYEYSATRHTNYHKNNINGDDTRPTADVQNYATAYAEQATDTMFLLDIKQIDTVYQNGNVLGSDYYVGEPTAECVKNAEYKNASSIAVGKKCDSWLRAVCSDNAGSVLRYVDSSTPIYTTLAWLGDITGVRPAFFLNVSTACAVSGAGTQSAPYLVTKTVSVTKTNGEKIAVEIPANLASTTQVILACYQAEKLTEVQLAVFREEPITFTATKDFDNAKILLWDSLTGLKPVCADKGL